MKGTGSTFPQPRWAGRAVRVARGGAAAAAILGDALHTFPPDLGQGANSGLEDVDTLLSAIELEQEIDSRNLTLTLTLTLCTLTLTLTLILTTGVPGDREG